MHLGVVALMMTGTLNSMLYAILFDNWITIIILFTIGGCVYKTSDLKKRILGIVLIIVILFMEWYLQ